MQIPNQLRTRRLFLFLVAGAVVVLYIYSTNLWPIESSMNKIELENLIKQKEEIYATFRLPATSLILPDKNTTLFEATPSDSAFCGIDGASCYLLLMFISSPENTERRSVIRKEILKQENQAGLRGIVVKHLFFMGTSSSSNFSMDNLIQEGTEFGDLIIDDFSESYFNLTVKSLRMLKWVQHNCPKTPFVAKIDDDVYFNLDLIIPYLQRVPDPDNLVAGHALKSSTPVTNPDSKFYTPESMWPSDKPFPIYASGVFYILGINVRQVIFEGALKSGLFHMEDVFITGILRAEFASWAEVSEIPGFINSYTETWWWFWWPCRFYREVPALHSLTLERLECFFRMEYFCCNEPYTAIQSLCG